MILRPAPLQRPALARAGLGVAGARAAARAMPTATLQAAPVLCLARVPRQLCLDLRPRPR